MLHLPILCAVVTYNRLAFTQACWESILRTTTPDEIRVGFFDNASTDGTLDWLRQLELAKDPRLLGVFTANQNIGTARAINHVWRLRLENQPCLKLDNDVVFDQPGWVTRMVEVLSLLPRLGELGLKRGDLAERAYYPTEPVRVGPFFRSQLYELHTGEIVESVNHVLGSCVMFSPQALSQMGDLYQMQDLGNTYGFDDSLASLRLRLLGFDCAFLRGKIGSPLTIQHIDPGEGGTAENGAWTREKSEHAREWMSEYNRVVGELQTGQREPYWIDAEVSDWSVQQAKQFMARKGEVLESVH